jgi:hypothetical protein
MQFETADQGILLYLGIIAGAPRLSLEYKNDVVGSSLLCTVFS